MELKNYLKFFLVGVWALTIIVGAVYWSKTNSFKTIVPSQLDKTLGLQCAAIGVPTYSLGRIGAKIEREFIVSYDPTLNYCMLFADTWYRVWQDLFYWLLLAGGLVTYATYAQIVWGRFTSSGKAGALLVLGTILVLPLYLLALIYVGVLIQSI